MPSEKDSHGPIGFGAPQPNVLDNHPGFGANPEPKPGVEANANVPTDLADGEPKITLPNLAEVEKSYVADNKVIEQCEDEALDALFGRPLTGRLQDPQNAQVLEKLNGLVERFNTTSARLEKIERGCQLLSEGIIKP